MASERLWFDAAFEEDYLAVYPHRDLAAGRGEVRGLVERGVRGRVLDLGCGFGRHLLALRELGLEVFGLDRSRALLRRVPAEVRGRVVRGDFRALPLASARFDTVVMLFSSFGYFEDEGNAAALAELARVLVPGGLALLDLMNPARVRTDLVPESRTRRGSLEIHERRHLAHGGTRVVKEVRLHGPGRGAGGEDSGPAERGWREDVRLYEPGELRRLLAAVGLTHLRSEGDFDGRPFAADSPRQIVWARA